MNALASNPFTRMLAEVGKSIPKPKAILCISAHWMTVGTWITGMSQPKTIHDFYGFPQELFAVQYPAPGNPDLAKEISSRVPDPKINLDQEMWGIDHGTWSVLKHMYPKADIPVLQLSLYMERPPEYHFELGRKLSRLRDQGVLIVGSGNIVHNLSLMKWEENAKPYTWAVEFDAWVKEKITNREFDSLLIDALVSEAGRLSIPSSDHWLPLLYTLGASNENEPLRFLHEGIDNASISMRCLQFGE